MSTSNIKLLFDHLNMVLISKNTISSKIVINELIREKVPHFPYFYDISYKYELTPRSRVLLEKVTFSQLVKKFPAVDGTRRFSVAFTSVCRLPLS